MISSKAIATAAATVGILAAGLLSGCGTSSRGPNGSMHQTMTGVSESGYPGGKPRDAESPALASSSEQEYSKPGPKVVEGK